MFTKILAGLITSLALFLVSPVLAAPDMTDWSDPKTSITFDATGDAIGDCDQWFKDNVDLVEGRVRDDADYLYFRFKINTADEESWPMISTGSSFLAGIDTNNDGLNEYTAEWTAGFGVVDWEYTRVYLDSITIWPPPIVHQFTESDFVAGDNVLEFRVPKSALPLIEDEYIWVRFDVYPAVTCWDLSDRVAYRLTADEALVEPEVCDDDLDNDLDGRYDCNDTGCYDQEYCENGLYKVKFEARIVSEPTVSDYWSADVHVVKTVMDHRGELVEVFNEYGSEQIYLSGLPDRVEGGPLFLNDLVEVEASFGSTSRNRMGFFSVKVIEDSPTIDLLGRVLPNEDADAQYARVAVCESDTDLGVTELNVYPPYTISGDIYDVGILSDTVVWNNASDLDSLLAGKCLQVYRADYANQGVRVRPNGYEVVSCNQTACGYDCAQMVAQIWEAPETLKREETFDPKTSISNLDFDDLTADYVSLAFGDNLLELFDQTVEPDTNYFIYPSEVNGEPFQVAEDAEYGLETLDMYLRYTDYNGRVCEDRAEQQITIVPPESLFMTVELDPGTFDLGSLTGASDTVQTLKMRARLGPDENDQYVSGKDVSFTIPCSLAYESCSGDYVVPSTGITLSDGYTGWVEAKVRTTANRVGNWTITANYEGDNLNYGPSEADATFRITGNIAEGALPVIECSETDHKSDCDEAMECIFNSGQQCLAELADLVPYLDKPTAVALAANDICEMASRTEGGDPVGAVVTGVLFTVDVGDNLADAVPVIGNAAGIVVDLIEGAIDCVEGIIYDQFKKCGGYTGCFVKVVDELAERGSQGIDWFEAHVLGFGSPVDVTILDADGSVLGIDDGVFVLDQEDAKFAVILNPEEIGDYQVRLRGTAHGTYSYQSAVIQEDQVVAQAEEADIEIALNEVVVYEDDEIMASGRAAWYWYALGGLISLVVLLGLTKVAFRSKKISR